MRTGATRAVRADARRANGRGLTEIVGDECGPSGGCPECPRQRQQRTARRLVAVRRVMAVGEAWIDAAGLGKHHGERQKSTIGAVVS